ncbi:MAG: S-ribosylhomocysteine lyase, partial [Clostridia bacterium]|nr:S-ribosylhomocysteine lyase [Clostridia bacterium]
AAMHSIEHILAVLLRNSQRGGDIVYFGPMGCRTGFYLITRNLDIESLKKLLIECGKKAQSLDSVPGASRKECGNYKEHNLAAAKKHISSFLRHI